MTLTKRLTREKMADMEEQTIKDILADADVDREAGTVTFRVHKGTSAQLLQALTMKALGSRQVVLLETRAAGPSVPGPGSYGRDGAYVTYGLPGALPPSHPRNLWRKRTGR